MYLQQVNAKLLLNFPSALGLPYYVIAKATIFLFNLIAVHLLLRNELLSAENVY